MKPAPFAYHASDSVEEAVDLLHQFGDDAKVIAGGQSLVPMLALRLAVFDNLVDVGRIAEMRGVARTNGTLVVGAGTPDVVMEQSPEVAESVPLLRKVTPLIGHFQIRNRGTVGGSLAHADPAAEYPAVAFALDAEVEVRSVRGSRTVAAEDLFAGIWTTSLEPDELLVGARFPVWTGCCGFGVAEFARRHGDFAIAGAVAGVELAGDGTITRAAIALLAMGPTPVRARAAEKAVIGARPDEIDPREVGELAVSDADEVPSDLHGPAAYRTRVGAAMAARAWSEALKEANDA